MNKKREFESFREFLRVFARFTYFYLGKILPNFFRLRLITRDFKKNIQKTIEKLIPFCYNTLIALFLFILRYYDCFFLFFYIKRG